MARSNVERFHGSTANWTLKLADIRNGIEERQLDRIIIDLPEPWRLLPEAWQALRAGAVLVAYVPTVLQMKHFVDRARLEGFASVEAIRPCHILFIPASATPAIQQQAIERVRGQNVLLVGESPGFAQRGGIVNFVIEANKIRFEVNVDAAAAQHLKISAKLLALAKIVETADAGRRQSGKLP